MYAQSLSGVYQTEILDTMHLGVIPLDVHSARGADLAVLQEGCRWLESLYELKGKRSADTIDI